ncbi:Xylan glycosyltransferase MUCI21 [Linum perenne]
MAVQSKKLYWKAAMGLHRHNHHQLLLEHDEEMAGGGGGGGGGLVLVFTNNSSKKPRRTKLISLLFFSVSLLSFFLILSPYYFPSLYSLSDVDSNDLPPPCSSVENGTICCDRTSSIRTDVCTMKGDIRTQSSSSSIFLYTSMVGSQENIRPYTRKWETSVMNTIDELHLVQKNEQEQHHCDVKHDVPAVFFSTGGYTGNVYHEFNDGILPLYLTSHKFNKKVVFVIVEYHPWWITKYADVLSELSDFPAVDFSGDNRTHCFMEAIVGLKIHDELSINPALVNESRTNIVDFHNLLDRAYAPRIKAIIEDEQLQQQQQEASSGIPNSRQLEQQNLNIPKLVIVSRNGSRSITNEDELVKLGEKVGFRVEVLRPDPTTELAKIYRSMNSSDVMIGVHGAAMTHFLFMKPGCGFIQVVPLGTEWAADSYYGEPARKMGLKYIGYRILPKESSLYEKYEKDDPVLRDPESVSQKGWEYTKKIYLESQNVKLDLRRFEKRLVKAYGFAVAKRNRSEN